MKIQLELNEIEEDSLKKCSELLGVNTKRRTLKDVIEIFPMIANRYEKHRSTITKLNNEIEKLENKIKALSK